jgi:CheY-like chemotaxis protein
VIALVKHRPSGTEAAVPSFAAGERIAALLQSKVVGQPSALETIVPSIHLHRSGLAPEGRPVGTFLLLGPTGTGKTRTVEAIAEVLHGTPHAVLRVDCGEFQSDHEIAKLIGAPPGYVGHFDSRARLSEEMLEEVRTENCGLALILFDEIEKAAPAMVPLLLSILDRAVLTLGSGDRVDFSRTLIFFTSNLGAREMMDEIRPGVGFDLGEPRSPAELRARLEGIGTKAVEKHFAPEFVNRIDAVVTYRPLDQESLVAILEHHIHDLQLHVHTRLGRRSFTIDVAPPARYFMIDRGTSLEYGARELRRVIHRHLTQPLAARVAGGAIAPGATVTVDLEENGDGLTFAVSEGGAELAKRGRTVLVVDGSDELLAWISRVLNERGCDVLAVPSRAQAEERADDTIDFAVIDAVLPDGDGIALARSLVEEHPDRAVIVTSGLALDDEDALVCDAHDFSVLLKPFLSDELVGALEARGARLSKVTAAGG